MSAPTPLRDSQRRTLLGALLLLALPQRSLALDLALPSSEDLAFLAVFRSAQAALDRGDAAEALALFDAAATRFGSRPQAELGAQRALLLAGDFAQALKRATTLVRAVPQYAEARGWLAFLQDRMGNVASSLQTLARARTLWPADATLAAVQIDLLIDRGMLDAAGQALATWPSAQWQHPDIQRLQRRLDLALATTFVTAGAAGPARTAPNEEAPTPSGTAALTDRPAPTDSPARAGTPAPVGKPAPLGTPSPVGTPSLVGTPALIGTSGRIWPAPFAEPSAPLPHGLNSAPARPSAGPGRSLQTANAVLLADGRHLLTVTQVLRDAKRIRVRGADGRLRPAQAIPLILPEGLALLRMEGPASNRVPPASVQLPWAPARAGALCFVLGTAVIDPWAGALPTVEPGIVQQAQCRTAAGVRISASLSSGHAGSPVFDSAGRLIGLVTDTAVVDPEDPPGVCVAAVAALPELPGIAPVALAQDDSPPRAAEQLYATLLPCVFQVFADG